MQFIGRTSPPTRVLRLLSIALIVVASITLPAEALQSVVLAWNPSPAPDIAGYRLYYGTQSGGYEQMILVTQGTSAAVSGLREGQTYFFAVTAFDASDSESLPSNEVSYTVPEPRLTMRPVPVPLTGPAKAFRFSTPGVFPSGWELQGSENLQTWKTLTGGSDKVDVVVLVSPESARFFRLNSDSPGQLLQTRKVAGDSFRGSFIVETAAPVGQWSLETSTDLNTWRAFTSGTNSAPHVSVINSRAPAMFFRIKRYGQAP
jgi:hypothetical protein